MLWTWARAFSFQSFLYHFFCFIFSTWLSSHITLDPILSVGCGRIQHLTYRHTPRETGSRCHTTFDYVFQEPVSLILLLISLCHVCVSTQYLLTPFLIPRE